MNRTIRYALIARRKLPLLGRIPLFACLLVTMLLATEAWAAPKIILISLDGATPRLVNRYLAGGVLSRHEGVGLLQSRGIKALRNITVSRRSLRQAISRSLPARRRRRTISPFTNPASIFEGQDSAKVSRYRNYLKEAYQVANQAVQAIIDAVGTDKRGDPNSNIFVVSDHGFAPFHTTVNINNLLASNGIDPTQVGAQVRAFTSGPALNIYIRLAGREPDGTVSQSEYLALQQRVVEILKNFLDTNPLYTLGAAKWPVFDKVYTRPADLSDPDFGRSTNAFIGQDSGDVFAVLSLGYNFDGTQNPVIIRQGDATSTLPILSVPNFYGAHGYDPLLPSMSAIFYAAGPDVGKGTLPRVGNVDIAPTIANILGVPPALTVHGRAIDLTPRRQLHFP